MAIGNHSYDQPKSYDIRRLLVAHTDNDVTVDIDDKSTTMTKPYPEGPYVSFKEGKRRAQAKRLAIAKAAEVEKKQAELNKQTTKTTLPGLNHSYKGKTSLATAA